MHSSLAEAVLRHMPQQVEVVLNGDWQYNRVYEELPGTIKIIERDRSGDYEFTNEYFSDGVRPRGYAVLSNILKRAFAECGIKDIEVSALLAKS